MTEDRIARDIVYQAIARTFEFPIEQISDATCALDVPGWDSINNAFLIMDIEEAINVELPLDAMIAADDVGALVKIIKQQLGR